jgi:AraC family multidrug resistance transcriptional activator
VELFRGWPGMPEIKASLPSPEHVYALFDHAQSLIPNSRHWPYLDIGKLLAQGLMGPSPAAVEALRSISRRNLQVDPPLSARALFCQGLVLRRLGQPLEALATFDAALQCAKPLDSWSITRDATLHMSRIHEELGNPGEALESYKIYSDLRLRGLVNNADLESAYFGPLEAVKPHEQHHQLRSLDPIFVKRATSYILDNIDKRISIDDVVRHSGVSRRTLETAFKEAKSSSIGRFIKTHKIQRASADLSYTKMSVNEVAKKYGFLSAEVFSRDFRSFFGCSPSRWRVLQ